MSNSLRDQLVKAGLASKQSADSINAKSRKKRHKPKSQQDQQAAKAAQKAAAKKREKDKALNAAIQEKQQKAALKGQIKALIEENAVKDYSGETTYSYIAGNKVRQLFVTEGIHTKLSADELAITRLNGKTFLVPSAIAEKIIAINPEWSVSRPATDSTATSEDDDTYPDYQVPDDLTW